MTQAELEKAKQAMAKLGIKPPEPEPEKKDPRGRKRKYATEREALRAAAARSAAARKKRNYHRPARCIESFISPDDGQVFVVIIQRGTGTYRSQWFDNLEDAITHRDEIEIITPPKNTNPHKLR